MKPNSPDRLTEIAKSLSNYTSIDGIVQSIVDAAAELTQAEGASLLLFDESEKVLYYAGTSWGAADPAWQRVLENVQVPLKAGVAGWVFSRQSTMIASKKGTQPLLHPAIEARLKNPIRSMAAVPLEFHSQGIGVLECFNHASDNFSSKDIETMETLASMASIAIYNAHLLQRAPPSENGKAELEKLQSNFISIASHELRTPLGVIIGHTAVLQEIADGDMMAQLDVIARNARHLNEIIENLTTINDLANGKRPSPRHLISLKRLILESMEKKNGEAQSRGIRLTSQLPAEDVFVEAQPKQLDIVLNNLLRNAFTFSGKKQGARVHIALQKNGTHAEITVLDNGIGISPEDQERIFDRFYQAEDPLRRSHGGMGIGLTTAKYLVAANEGEIRVKSEVGKGSAFTVRLPLSKTKQPVRAFLE